MVSKIRLRKVLRKARRTAALACADAKTSIEHIARVLSCPRDCAAAILEVLIESGYVESAPPHKLTPAGERLATKNLLPRLRRSKAQQIVADMLKRCDAINGRSDLTDSIESVHVFGSYITDAETLGDIDVAVTTRRRIEDRARYWEACIARADARNLQLRHDEKMEFGRKEVLKLVKNGHPYISLHEMYEVVELLGAPHRKIYPK